MPVEIINLPTAQRTGSTTATSNGAHEGAAAGRAQSSNHQQSNQAENGTEKAAYTDTVTFTETATQLQAIENEIADIPVVNMARVEAVQSRLENDTFEIDTDKLANNILRFETQL